MSKKEIQHIYNISESFFDNGDITKDTRGDIDDYHVDRMRRLSQAELDALNGFSFTYVSTKWAESVALSIKDILDEEDSVYNLLENCNLKTPNIIIYPKKNITKTQTDFTDELFANESFDNGMEYFDFVDAVCDCNTNNITDDTSIATYTISVVFGDKPNNIENMINTFFEAYRIYMKFCYLMRGFNEQAAYSNTTMVTARLSAAEAKGVIKPGHPSINISKMREIRTHRCDSTAAMMLAKMFTEAYRLGDLQEVNPDEIEGYLNRNNDNSIPDKIRKYINACSKNPSNLYKLKYEIIKKNLIITVPDNIFTRLNNINMWRMLNEFKGIKELNLRVDGKLLVSSLFELHNLKCLDRDYMHNCLVVKCEISPDIMRFLLCMAGFKTLDLSKSTFTQEMNIDMSYVFVKNRDCDIILKDGAPINIKR